jgi:hypothetical protein
MSLLQVADEAPRRRAAKTGLPMAAKARLPTEAKEGLPMADKVGVPSTSSAAGSAPRCDMDAGTKIYFPIRLQLELETPFVL